MGKRAVVQATASHWGDPLIHLAAAAITCILLVRFRGFYHDDAYITLRYVERFFAGQGLTWTDGEPVEGFTHPLWLAQLVVLGWLGVDLPTASRGLGIAYMAALFALWRRARAAPGLLLLLATQPGLVLWTLGGLETTSFCFWLAAAAWLVQQACEAAPAKPNDAQCRAAQAGAALAAAALTRPEGIGAGVLALAWMAIRTRDRSTLAAVSVFGFAVGAYQVFRLVYYGDLFPNTAYVKLGVSATSGVLAGIEYLWRSRAVWVPGTVAAAVALALVRQGRPLGMLWVAVPVVVSLLVAGGDHMVGARLVLPAVVVLTLAAAVGGSARGFQRPSAVGLLAVGVAALQVQVALAFPATRDPAAAVGEPIGQYLQRHLPSGTLVAAATAGSTPYFAPSLRFIDTLGLNDRHIARRDVQQLCTPWQRMPGHRKGDGEYVLRRAPDVIILGPAEGFVGADPRAWFLTDFELLASPEFQAHYRPYRFSVSVTLTQAGWPAVARLLDDSGRLPLVAYLRESSVAARSLASLGLPLRSPPRYAASVEQSSIATVAVRAGSDGDASCTWSPSACLP